MEDEFEYMDSQMPKKSAGGTDSPKKEPNEDRRKGEDHTTNETDENDDKNTPRKGNEDVNTSKDREDVDTDDDDDGTGTSGNNHKGRQGSGAGSGKRRHTPRYNDAPNRNKNVFSPDADVDMDDDDGDDVLLGGDREGGSPEVCHIPMEIPTARQRNFPTASRSDSKGNESEDDQYIGVPPYPAREPPAMPTGEERPHSAHHPPEEDTYLTREEYATYSNMLRERDREKAASSYIDDSDSDVDSRSDAHADNDHRESRHKRAGDNNSSSATEASKNFE